MQKLEISQFRCGAGHPFNVADRWGEPSGAVVVERTREGCNFSDRGFECPSCGEAVWTSAVSTFKGVRTETPCEDKCSRAVGAVCKCSCAGMNHGTRA